MLTKSILIRAGISQLVLAWLWNTKAMPNKALILHVGFHKSGTSALQESFSAQRAELKAFGIWYPDIGRKAHHRIAWALTQKPWGWKTRGGQVTPFRHFTSLVRKINNSKHQKVLLSSEFFSELTVDQIQRIAGAVKNREIKILFTLRPLVKVLSSSYQQYLKYGTKVDYVEWLHSVLDDPGVSKITPSFWKRHLHGEVVENWASVFGSANVSVVLADETKPEFLFESVNELLALPKGFLKPQEVGGNRSLSVAEISLLLNLNRVFPKTREWDEYRIFIRNGYVRRLTDSVPVNEASGKLPTPAWAIQAANKISSGSKQKIKDLGVQVIGDLEKLDAGSVLEGEPKYSDSIDIETVSQAMLAFDKGLVRRIPNRWTRAEFVYRFKRKILGLLGMIR
jgi:hypothetical protein